MVQGAVTDFFRQTVLDFTYGSIGLHGLERYYDDLNSRDPSESIRLARVRTSAIESCRREVVPDIEPLIGGWTLCSPLQPNTVQALKLEEKVALLTYKALYVCSYDFGSEKLNEFTKVLVGDIVGIQEGESAQLPRHTIARLQSSALTIDLRSYYRAVCDVAARVFASRRQLGRRGDVPELDLSEQHDGVHQEPHHHSGDRFVRTRCRRCQTHLCVPRHLGRGRGCGSSSLERNHAFAPSLPHGQRRLVGLGAEQPQHCRSCRG